MKPLLLLLVLWLNPLTTRAQTKPDISTVEFVAVINNHHAEALYYYLNNWKPLREAALKQGYIADYKLLEIEPSKATPYNFILITTYANQAQFDARESHFEALIQAADGLKLLNTVKPNDFRQFVHGQDQALSH